MSISKLVVYCISTVTKFDSTKIMLLFLFKKHEFINFLPFVKIYKKKNSFLGTYIRAIRQS